MRELDIANVPSDRLEATLDAKGRTVKPKMHITEHESHPARILLVVLAAGASRRFTGVKLAQLVHVSGESNPPLQSLLRQHVDKMQALTQWLTTQKSDNPSAKIAPISCTTHGQHTGELIVQTHADMSSHVTQANRQINKQLNKQANIQAGTRGNTQVNTQASAQVLVILGANEAVLRPLIADERECSNADPSTSSIPSALPSADPCMAFTPVSERSLQHARLSPESGTPALHIKVNHHWQSGLASSLQLAAQYATEQGYDAMLLTLADQVALQPIDYQQLLSSWLKTGDDSACYYADDIGVPAVFTASTFAKFSELSGDYGAKSILKQQLQQGRLQVLPMPNAAIDIDTQADLASWLACNVCSSKGA